jgi:hypothetical protein
MIEDLDDDRDPLSSGCANGAEGRSKCLLLNEIGVVGFKVAIHHHP